MQRKSYYASALVALGLILSTPAPALAASATTAGEDGVKPMLNAPAATLESRTSVRQSPTSNQVGVHLLSLFINRINIEYERRITPHWSVLVAPKVGIGKLASSEFADIFGSSVGLEVGGRWFVSGNALQGFFMQPTLSYNHFYMTDSSADRLSLNGKVGYQWMIADRAFFNLSGGAMYTSEWRQGQVASSWAKSAEHTRGFTPDASFSIGFGF